MDKKGWSIYMDVDIIEAVEKIAKRDDRSVSSVVKRALKAYMDEPVLEEVDITPQKSDVTEKEVIDGTAIIVNDGNTGKKGAIKVKPPKETASSSQGKVDLEVSKFIDKEGRMPYRNEMLEIEEKYGKKYGKK